MKAPRFSKEQLEQMGVWECPDCGSYNPKGRKRCESCDHIYGMKVYVEIPQISTDTGQGCKKEVSATKRTRKGVMERLNKTEMRFYKEYLLANHYDAFIFPQAITLDFGDGTSYRPDFFVIDTTSKELLLFEVKGGHVGKVAWSRHGIERYRRAKDKWGGIFKFVLYIWKDKQWQREKGL